MTVPIFRKGGSGPLSFNSQARRYDGETLLLGSAMLERTQAFVHLARYDGHLSRRFFRAVKQLSDLRRDERKAREARSYAGSYTSTDPYRGRYAPAQAPPPIDTPHPRADRIGFRASRESTPQAGLRDDRTAARQTTRTQTTKQTQFGRTPMKLTPSKGKQRRNRGSVYQLRFHFGAARLAPYTAQRQRPQLWAK